MSSKAEIDRPVPPPEPTLKSPRAENFRERLRTPRETATFLGVSNSWLSKSRMRGDGPPFVKVGRSVRYPEGTLLQWMKSNLHLSTSER